MSEDTVALAEDQVTEDTGADGTAEGTDTQNEAQEASRETEQPTGPTEEEINAAVEAFKAVVEGVMVDEGRDTATGELSEKLLADVKVAFANLPAGKARTQAKAWVDGKVGEAIDQADAASARSYYRIKQNSMTAARAAAGTVARAAVDPVRAFVEEVAALYLAPWAVVVPENVPENWGDQVSKLAESLQDQIPVYTAWVDAMAALPEDASDEDKPAEPEVNDVVKRAVRIARGRSANVKRARAARSSDGQPATRAPYTGTRRDIGKHIIEALEDARNRGIDFLPMKDLGNFKSTEYGNDKPSGGAIQARLFPTNGKQCTLAGVVPTIRDGKRGAMLAK